LASAKQEVKLQLTFFEHPTSSLTNAKVIQKKTDQHTNRCKHAKKQ